MSSKESSNHKDQILLYVKSSQGLLVKKENVGGLSIQQKTDGKQLHIQLASIEEIISRDDGQGDHFLQINFMDGKKILITQQLVGFKPHWVEGLDSTRLPKVVTTPDLISVVEAIQEGMELEPSIGQAEIEVLKRVYESVLEGGEAVGFDMTQERAWLHQFYSLGLKPSA